MEEEEEGVATHRVQEGGGSEVWQEAHLQQVEEEALLLHAVHPVQEQHHGRLVVGLEAGRHVWLSDRPVWGEGVEG